MVRSTAVLVGAVAVSLAASASAAVAPTAARTFFNSHGGAGIVVVSGHGTKAAAPVFNPGGSFVVSHNPGASAVVSSYNPGGSVVIESHNPAPATTTSSVFGVVDESDADEMLTLVVTPTPEATVEATPISKVMPTAAATAAANAPAVVVVDKAEETTKPTPACVPMEVGGVFCSCVDDVLTCPPTPSPTPEAVLVEETATPMPSPTPTPKSTLAPTPVVVEVVEETATPMPSPTPTPKSTLAPTPVVVEVVEETATSAPSPAVAVDPITIDVSDGSAQEAKKDDGDMEVEMTTAPTPTPAVAPATAMATPTPMATPMPTPMPTAMPMPTAKPMAMAKVKTMKCADLCANQEKKELMACASVAATSVCTGSIEHVMSHRMANSDAASSVAGMVMVAKPKGAFVAMGTTTSVVSSCTSVTPMPHGMCVTSAMMKMCTAVMCMTPSMSTPAISNAELIKQVEAAIAGAPMPGISIDSV